LVQTRRNKLEVIVLGSSPECSLGLSGGSVSILGEAPYLGRGAAGWFYLPTHMVRSLWVIEDQSQTINDSSDRGGISEGN
jgi:hypothetical protein